MADFSEAEIDAFVAAEAKYHGGALTRERAVQFMAQREAQACLARPERPPLQHEDSYGTLRWNDTNERVGR